MQDATRRRFSSAIALTLAFTLASTLAARKLPGETTPFIVQPNEVHLKGPFARSQLLVTAVDSSGMETSRSADLTHQSKFTTSDPKVVTVDAAGRLLAVGNGQAMIQVTVGEPAQTKDVPVTVAELAEPPVPSYLNHVSPILSKAGCNAGACHASQHGKGGFVLSVFGFDPDADRKAIVRDREQRRVDLMNSERSLFLLKPTMRVAHGGGTRLKPNSVDYLILKAWLDAGAPGPDAKAAQLTAIEVWPKHRVTSIAARHQLRVEAIYDDGSRRDVTAWARYDTMDDVIVSVQADGLVRAVGQGQAPVMVRFEGQAQIAMFVVPFAASVALTDWKNNNVIDELAAAKFRELGLEPSPLCDDATFVRRAFLDAIGTIPTIEETRAFLSSTDPQKREKLVDRLLGLTGDPAQDIYNDHYAAIWTLKWADLIRNTSREVGDQGMWALHNWLQQAFRANRPVDQIVRDLITGKGSVFSNGPANYYLINKDAAERTESTAQLFLGVRLECAKCHHHPFEKYGQDDYYAFSAFFSRVGLKNSQEFGLFGGERVVVVQPTGDVRQPRTGKLMEPRPLDGATMDHALDRRIPLAEWLTSRDNPFFARSIVNRYVGYLLGRGLVEPVDDMRSTNPPSNPALMDELTKRFIASNFNLKLLVKDIMNSRLYQLDSQPTPSNAWDSRYYSHYNVKRITAEPLLDAVDRVTGIPTKFKDLPLGTRAIQLPDAEYPDYFLNTFAKPRRASVCECERPRDENLAQALHTLNGDVIAGKVSNKEATVAKLIAAGKSHPEIVEHLYLVTLCRFPTPNEMEASWTYLDAAPSAAECYEDLMWALINSKQFLFIR